MHCPICLSPFCSWFRDGVCGEPIQATSKPAADLCDGGLNNCRCRERQSE